MVSDRLCEVDEGYEWLLMDVGYFKSQYQNKMCTHPSENTFVYPSYRHVDKFVFFKTEFCAIKSCKKKHIKVFK